MDDNPITECVFCAIIAGKAPAAIVREWPDTIAIIPLDPVVDGHVLILPRQHVTDATTRPDVTAYTMRRAAELAADLYDTEHSNILTSIGAPATQSIFHLHLHVVPRTAGDELMLPWGTTGNPNYPHRCKGIDAREAELERLQAELAEEKRIAALNHDMHVMAGEQAEEQRQRAEKAEAERDALEAALERARAARGLLLTQHHETVDVIQGQHEEAVRMLNAAEAELERLRAIVHPTQAAAIKSRARGTE